jgi:hypothetical protein
MGTTTGKTHGTGRIKSEGKREVQKVAFSPLMEGLTRVGYGARGLIYITMGLLAVGIALQRGGAPADQQGAIAAISRQPAGLILLWVVLVGLISYSLWGVIRAVLDPLRKGHDLKGLLARGGFLFSAASYGLLILPTYGFITGAGQRAQAGQTQQSLASIMAMPWGRWVVGAIGLAVIAGGLHQVYEGVNASFDRQFKTYAMSAKEIKWATQLGRFGTAARGLIFAVVGGLLCVAAYQSNSNQDIGVDAALAALLRQPYGAWLLAIVAVGLIAFGVYSMLTAVWFQFKNRL